MISAFSPSPSAPRSAALCPECGSARVRITTSIPVQYDVVYEALNHDFRVVDELLGDAMWDAESGASCLRCAWHGTVADLRRSEAAAS